MENKFAYYKGYEETEDDLEEDLSDIESESSDDEIEKEIKRYFESDKINSKLDSKELAKKFENDMDKELDNLIRDQEKKYLCHTSKFNEGTFNSVVSKKDNSEQKLSEINYEDEEDTDSEKEFETGIRSTKKKVKFSNDELFYDPEMDNEDENWINKFRPTSKKSISIKQSPSKDKTVLKPTTSSTSLVTNDSESSKIISYSSAQSDAVLNCPCCMCLLCMDCQRHESFKTQYRAMFVFNCKIKQDEQLKYPKKMSYRKGKKNKKEKCDDNMTIDQQTDLDQQNIDIFKPVACNICNAEVGVYDDKDEIYYFFNVLASHS